MNDFTSNYNIWVPRNGSDFDKSGTSYEDILTCLPVLNYHARKSWRDLYNVSKEQAWKFENVTLTSEWTKNWLKGVLEAHPGHCYLIFLYMIPQVHVMGLEEFQRLTHMFFKLGRIAPGWHVFRFISILDLSLDKDHSPPALLSQFDSINTVVGGGNARFFLNLTYCPLRFDWTMKDDVDHFEFGSPAGAILSGSPEIIKYEGPDDWFLSLSARSAMEKISTFGSKVGAKTVDISSFFEEGVDDTVDDFSTAPLNINSGFKVVDKGASTKGESDGQRFSPWLDNAEQRRVDHNDSMSQLEKEIELLRVKCSLEKELDSRRTVSEQGQGRPSRRVNSMSEEDEDGDTILPDDSSSTVERYCKTFMQPGTVLSVRRGKSLSEEDRIVSYTPSRVPDVVVGYIKSESLARREASEISQVKPINGLCRPFRSKRLNELIHISSAIDLLIETSVMREPLDLLEVPYLRQKSPSIELLGQIVLRTFDTESGRIVANPFELPYLEVGMQLTDDSMVKCFSLLREQTKILWFQEFKSLRVPDFHNDFNKLSDLKTTSARQKQRNRSQASRRSQPKSETEQKQPPKSESRSILSVMRSKH